jgi:hypothetical protein
MTEYWVVLDTSTGRVICHCGEESDAIMMVEFSPQNRSYRKQKFLMDNVINVNFSKAKELPGQQGLPASKFKLDFEPNLIHLPLSNEEPLDLK